jgi:hypothetical protein
MFNRASSNSFLARLLAGLAVAVTMVVVALSFAVSNSQAYF